MRLRLVVRVCACCAEHDGEARCPARWGCSHLVLADELVAVTFEDRLVKYLGVDVGDVVVGVSLDELDGAPFITSSRT